jgi:tetratricopeptide (TPR) repeat protein
VEQVDMAILVSIKKDLIHHKMIIRFKYLLALLVSFAIQQSVFSQNLQVQASEKSSAIDSTFTEHLYSKALQEISQQDFQGAENSLIQVLKADPNHDDARFALIRIYFAQKQLDKAEALAREGLKLSPDKAILWEALADIYKETKKYKEILPVFEQLIRINPDQIKNYLDKAYSYGLIKDYQSALSTYDKTQAKFGDKESIYSGRIAIYIQQNNAKKALQEANKYLKKNPNDSRAYLMLAHLYLDLKEPKEALKILNEAEVKFPNDPYIYLTKADVYQELKDDNELLIQLKKAFSFKSFDIDSKIKILFNVFQDIEPAKALVISDALSQVLIETHPEDPSAYAVYGDILLQQNKNEEALIKFKEALKLNPKIEAVWENVLQIEVAESKFLDAQKDGELALSYFPQNAMLLLFTGYSFSLDKKYNEARSYLEAALNNVDPKNKALQLQIYSSLGDLYNHIGLSEVSNAAYDEALAIDSNNTYVLNNYAYYLAIRKESLEKAATYSKRSNELQPKNASFQDTYAWVLFQQGKYKKALIWIEDAIKSSVDPSSTLLEHHGDILFKLGKEKEALSNWQNALKISLSTGQNADKLERKIKNKKYEE